MVYDAEVATAAMVHAMFGVSWFGANIASELILVPTLTKSTKLVELAPIGLFAPRISMVGMMTGILTIVTGMAFLAVKFGTDTSVWFRLGETQAVLAALFTGIASLVFGMAILRPAAMALAKNRPPTPPPPEAEVPPPVKAKLMRVAMYLHVQMLFVVLMLVFMVIAIEGGF